MREICIIVKNVATWNKSVNICHQTQQENILREPRAQSASSGLVIVVVVLFINMLIEQQINRSEYEHLMNSSTGAS